MGGTKKYEYWGVTKELPMRDGTQGRFKFHEHFQTKSARSNKVVQQIEKEIVKKFGVNFEYLEDFGFQLVK